MSYLLLFVPVWMSMALALRDQYERRNTISTVLLALTSVLITIRFYIVAFFFDGGQMNAMLHWAEFIASLYIMPCAYMFLCDQCGTFWNNRVAKTMLVLPFLTLLSPIIGMEKAELRDWIVVVHCLIIAFCMVRLWLRIRSYELPFTQSLKLYYLWMGSLLSFTILTFICGINHTSSSILHWIFFSIYAVVIAAGYLIIPYSFMIENTKSDSTVINNSASAPQVTTALEEPKEERNVPVETAQMEVMSQSETDVEDEESKLSQYLIDAIHHQMEDEEYYLGANINIDDLAHRIGTNRTYITKLMRQEYGLTFIEYITAARIQHSQKMLFTHPELTLEEVSMKSGFQSTSNYCRAFKRITGSTPKQWLQESMR